MVADQDFPLVILLMTANNFVQWSLYVLFANLDAAESAPRQEKPTTKELARILMA